MARPKLGNGETQRLHLNISSEELTAIDDWRFENRIPTRAEAIRRLCQVGLIFDYFARTYGPDALDLVEAIEPDNSEAQELSPEDKQKAIRLLGGFLVFAGKAFRFSGRGNERLQDLLENEAYLKALAQEDEDDK